MNLNTKTVMGLLDLKHNKKKLNQAEKPDLANNEYTKSKIYLDYIVNNLPHYIFWKDTNSVFQGCNQKFAESVGLRCPNDIIGKTDYDMPWKLEESDAYIADDKAIMESGEGKLNYEEHQSNADGTERIMLVSKVPMYDNDNNITGVLGIYTDITPRKKMEQELIKSKQAAEAASMAKTQFLAMMGHEFRLPLTGIISTANMLVETDISLDESRELGKIIEQSGSHLLSTINNILDYAKLDVRKYQLALEELNLKALIEEICAMFDASAREKNISLEINYDESIPSLILSDTRILRHIINNLISNGIKYTEKGKVTITVTECKKRLNATQLKISVQDTGMGIPKSKLKYIFDRFYQVENTYTKKYSRNGTGLGLSIVKKLVSLLNSEIKVTSTLNKGSTFYFVADFPLTKKSLKTKTGKRREKDSIS